MILDDVPHLQLGMPASHQCPRPHPGSKPTPSFPLFQLLQPTQPATLVYRL